MAGLHQKKKLQFGGLRTFTFLKQVLENAEQYTRWPREAQSGETTKEQRWQEIIEVVEKKGEKWASQRKTLGDPMKKENQILGNPDQKKKILKKMQMPPRN